ncbi:MAG: hypothetical protein GKR87_01915 [Kiritimatiellae bacterium]|nr:hypothetical protein [Kiritimatiellia bacterium]
MKNTKKVIGLLLIIGIVICLFFLPIKDYLATFLEWIQGVGPAGAIVLTFVYILACIFFIPGSILTLGAGFAFGVVLGTITVSIASILGASSAFLLGRTFARNLIELKVQNNAKFSAIERAVEKQGFKIVLLTRLSPVFPFNVLNYAFGLTKVSLRDYFFGSWIGMFPGTVMYVYFGSTLKSLADVVAGNVEGGIGEKILFIGGLTVTVVVTVFVTRIAKALNVAVPERDIEPAKT